MKQHPATKVQVTGGGSGTGFAALINGTTEIAASSRPIKPAETNELRSRYGSAPTQTSVAKDGVAFYVNTNNPVRSLTPDQLGPPTSKTSWASTSD